MIIKIKIKFRFTFSDESTMETSHIGFSSNSKEGAIMNAWENMAKDCFDANLILKTERIELIHIQETL